MTLPLILDIYCKAGGAGKGYADAGFEVIGVDIEPQPHYPFEFHEADALDVLAQWEEEGEIFGRRPVAAHASPPCQASSVTRHATGRTDHPELIPPTRELLVELGVPYVIENVVGAKLHDPLRLCGTSFALPIVDTRDGERRQLYRHRLFECNFPVMSMPCSHTVPAIGVYGHGPWDRDGDLRRGGYQGTSAERAEAMRIDWMNRDELSQAIPPVYTEHIGHALFVELARREALLEAA